jgi:aminomuconate-semialdehyde/2-hydroxymuconate-6-semialdehyde dehydrogenase
MMKIADIVESRQDEFAAAESRDQGKPIWLAKAIDINRVCLNFRFFASGILHVIDT